MTVDKMILGKIVAYRMSVVKLSVDRMSVYEMACFHPDVKLSGRVTIDIKLKYTNDQLPSMSMQGRLSADDGHKLAPLLLKSHSNILTQLVKYYACFCDVCNTKKESSSV
jgi:hypothetical protein